MTPTAADSNSVTCTQCGGANPLPSGRQVIRCTFCDAALFVDRSGVVQHYMLPALLDGEQAKAALRRWMAGNDTVKDLDEKSVIDSLEAISFPMWLFRARGPGGEDVYVEPAAPTPVPQLADLRVPAGKLEPYREADTEARTVAAVVPLETARGWMEQRGVGQVVETALVRVPLWTARYRHDGHPYTALVDAATGTVLAAVYPEKAESPYVLVAALGLVLFGIEGLVISNLVVKFLAYAVTAVPLAALAYWVTRKV